MKVLLDENLPRQLRAELSGHDVSTVQYLGWSGVKNGALMRQAAAAGFEVMVTMDNGIAYQQNLSTIPLAIVVMSAVSNDIEDLRPLLPELREALAGIEQKTVVRIG